MAKLAFENVLRSQIGSHVESLRATASKKPLAAGNSFIEIVVRALKLVDLSKLDRSAVLDVVSKLYDEQVAPIDLPGNFDLLLHSIIKQTVLTFVGIAFDKLQAQSV